jgi:TfoX/Sxy family transcriptional regulator of competence genes
MAYSEEFADRIRLGFHQRDIVFEERKMMGGLCYMVDHKMCVGLLADKASGQACLMARIGEAAYPQALAKAGVSEMNFTGRSMKGYVFVDEVVLESESQLGYWLDLALAFNPLAKASKKNKRSKLKTK